MKRLVLLPVLLLAACGPSKPPRGQTLTAEPVREEFTPVDGQATADDIARFLAGRPVRHGAALSQMQQTGNYRSHAEEMATKWRVFASKRTARQREWSNSTMAPIIGNPRTLLYPFGGPDLLYATALFPQASNYVLLGLEPPGGLPNLDNADPDAVMSSLGRLNTAMDAQLKTGYFITKDMKNDLSGGPLPGVTPILLASLSLMDATVENVQGVNAAGRSAVEIQFRLPGGGSRRATYVAGDVSNGGFNSSYRGWLSSYSGCVGYFKAASYLMHDSGFSGIRDWMLSNCHAVVQDDSGIPYRYYDSSKWDIHLFGNYDAPIELFAKHSQADLRAAYNAIGGGPALSFGSGYAMRPGDANLMIAVRK
ncbi:hypothetical protein [Haloferula sp. BvORR071]|uniref:hypothetical protein n=1 Tax=Haloferula sp. BvORR071 TaxID=1396141 RepID=UPI0005564D80|nr:hypothetical protein [Haloferula sp. BvORR071]